MKKAQIQGHVVTSATHPVGRLVKANYDSQRHVMSFDVPSSSRKKQGRVYGIELDCTTGQIACPCEAFRDFRNASRMPYRKEIGGEFLEQVNQIYPLITRPPRFNCPHARKVRLYLQRHKTPDGQTLFDILATVVKAWEEAYLEKSA